jgi:S1-C subfamily serine protease
MVATSYHVVQDAARIVVTPIGDDEHRYEARLLKYDSERDVALLKVNKLKGPPLELLSEGDLYIGDTIYTLGNPAGLEGTFSNGIISNLAQSERTLFMQFTAPVSPGSSGSPVFNSNGQVIGIVDMQLKEGQNLNFAVLAIHVKMLMEGQTELPPGTYIDRELGSDKTRRK